MNQDDESLAEQLMRAAEASADEDLDPNDLAALAAGEADTADRQRILARITADDRRATALLAREAELRSVPRLRRRRWSRAAAAVVLLAVGGALVFGLGDERSGTLDDADLTAAFRALAGREPVLMADLEPLLAAERVDTQQPTERGGLHLLRPRGVLLDARPTFSWVPVPGAAAYRLVVFDEDGAEALALSSAGAQHAWPQGREGLVPGRRYVWKVEATVAGEHMEGSLAFSMAGADLRARHEALVAAAATTEPAALRPLVRAHLAIRLGLLFEAERELAGAQDTAATRGLLVESRAWLAARLGESASGG